MTPPRVAYVLRAFPRLSETFILHELLAQRARGTEVRVFALERSGDERMHPEAERLLPQVTFLEPGEPATWNGPRRVPKRQRRWAAAGAGIADELQAWGATHVHAHFAGPAATAACFAAMSAGISFSFTAHAKDIFVDSLDWEWLAWLGSKAHAVITVCDYNRRYLRRRMPDARVVRIYNGVDLERWALPGRRARPANGPVVTVGRFVRKKGFDVLVSALGLLRDRGLRLHAVLVGDGAEWDAVRSLARAQRLGRLARFPGALTQPEVREVLAAASVVVLPCVVDADGNQDALPTVLLEASACSLPCVATRVGGVPEIVQDGVTGRVVAPGDAAALADAIASLMASSRRRDRMGLAARRRAERLFDQRRAAQALGRLFSEASRAPRPRVPSAESPHAYRAAVL